MSITEAAFDRDRLAEWYGHRHYRTDAGVQRIFYLPANSPPREIRLLEVNGLIPEMSPLQPIDFGVDIGGAEAHTLYVLDVTANQWQAIENGELELPSGWSLEGKKEIAPGDGGK
ncbi:MAG: hypothetical protein ACREHD_01150 [Pirellulales bacterium]